MTRKIIQIAATPETKNSFRTVFALCDDGTVWDIFESGDGWELLPPIPQGQLPSKTPPGAA